MRPNYTRRDFAHNPFVVFYEVTRACDLVCRHCRACAQAWRDPNELDTADRASPHQHVRKENNILFPKALALEAALAPPQATGASG